MVKFLLFRLIGMSGINRLEWIDGTTPILKSLLIKEAQRHRAPQQHAAR